MRKYLTCLPRCMNLTLLAAARPSVAPVPLRDILDTKPRLPSLPKCLPLAFYPSPDSEMGTDWSRGVCPADVQFRENDEVCGAHPGTPHRMFHSSLGITSFLKAFALLILRFLSLFLNLSVESQAKLPFPQQLGCVLASVPPCPALLNICSCGELTSLPLPLRQVFLFFTFIHKV